MKQFYCAEDIERLVAQGRRTLVVGEDTALTDLARDRAQKLGLSLVTQSRPQHSLPPDVVQGKPKGCQHGPLGAAPSGNTHLIEDSDQVVDELVRLVRQLKDKTSNR